MGIATKRLSGVDIAYWNPLRRRPAVPPLCRTNNFGDLLGPLIVEAVRDSYPSVRRATSRRRQRLMTVGSILHFARTGDTVWGTGMNGKIPDAAHTFANLDVRAVRGPLTREFLLRRGIPCPEVYGDPALLIPHLFPGDLPSRGSGGHDVLVVPNLHDFAATVDEIGHRYPILDPRQPVSECLRAIADSSLVVGSSLHGMIVAEAFGVPARAVVSAAEPEFKYLDYLRGTGREVLVRASSIAEAISLGGQEPIVWDSQPLLAAFPHDLWS